MVRFLHCRDCGQDLEDPMHTLAGYCWDCREQAAKKIRHTIVPMAKSNYVVVTDLELLKGLNKYANC